MEPDDLREADWSIIEVLREGRNNAPNISDRTGYSKQYIRERFKRLSDEGMVRNIGSGIYELIPEEVPKRDWSIKIISLCSLKFWRPLRWKQNHFCQIYP